MTFDSAADGTAVLVGGNPDFRVGLAGTVRAPGGAFPSPLKCGYSLRMFGPKAHSSAVKPIAKAKGTIAAGATKQVKLRLGKRALKALKRSHRLKVRIAITFTTGTTKTEVTRKATLKRR